MSRAKLVSLALGLALVSLFAAPAAGAQDGPSITVEPGTVDAPGDYEFTITGADWTAAPPIFVLPCDYPEGGDITAVDAATCDTANLTPVTPTDGAFEVTVTYTVPEGGMAIAAGDAASTEGTAFAITVGGGDAGGDDGAADDSGVADAVAEEAPTMPVTGVESAPLAIMGTAVLAAGAMVVSFSRRLER